MITDIKMTDGFDLQCDQDGIPIFITDLDVVSQDVKHAILESGLLQLLLAERAYSQRQSIYNKLIILVEEDARIIPGTCEIQEVSVSQFRIKATADQGTFTLNLGVL